MREHVLCLCVCMCCACVCACARVRVCVTVITRPSEHHEHQLTVFSLCACAGLLYVAVSCCAGVVHPSPPPLVFITIHTRVLQRVLVRLFTGCCRSSLWSSSFLCSAVRGSCRLRRQVSGAVFPLPRGDSVKWIGAGAVLVTIVLSSRLACQARTRN